MEKKQITVTRVICKIRRANEPRWNEEFRAVYLKEAKEDLKRILNKHGRISKGSYQYSIKVNKYDEDCKSKEKPAYTIVSNWKGKLGMVEEFIMEHMENWIFANELLDLMEDAMEKFEK